MQRSATQKRRTLFSIRAYNLAKVQAHMEVDLLEPVKQLQLLPLQLLCKQTVNTTYMVSKRPLAT
jgi:hypothetical protein